MLKLVIAEKPSMGRTIASAVGATIKKNGYIEGNGFIVSWCFGHLYELQTLEAYINPNWTPSQKANWKDTFSSLPFFPTGWKFNFVPKESCKDQIKILKELINRKDVSEIYSAGDADREGQVIVDLVIVQNIKSKKTVKRLWLPSLTEDVILEGIKNAKADMEYINLYQAGKTRAYVDWLIGIELTRYASVLTHSFVRIGRCVCPIVSKIVEREEQIRTFVPKDYNAVTGTYKDDSGSLKLVSEKQFDGTAAGLKEAQEYARVLSSNPTVVDTASTKTATIKPKRLFSMSDLQSYICKKNRNMTPTDVLNTVQSLYEKGFVTYPRTSSNYLADDEYDKITAIIEKLNKNPDVRKNISGMMLANIHTKDVYDNDKVESHSALTPTANIPILIKLSKDEQLVYLTILKRFASNFCTEQCKVSRTTYTLSNGSEHWKENGDVMIDRGWASFEDYEKKDSSLPKLNTGDQLNIIFAPEQKKTSAPKRFTVASLNSWMKSPLKKEEFFSEEREYTNEEIKDILSEATICTEATRAGIIDSCVASKYIELKDGSYYALPAGYALVKIMDDLHINLSVEKTVNLSRELHDISLGKATQTAVLEETKEMLTKIMEKKEYKRVYVPTGNPIGTCPRCGKNVYETPKAYSCEDKDCGFLIWKENKYFKAIGYTPKIGDIKKLLSDGKFLAKGLTSKKGSKYDAYLCLDDSGKYVSFKMEFPENPNFEPQKSGKPIGKCPRCGKDVYETPKSYACEDKDCGWIFWKNNKLLQAVEFHLTNSKMKMLLQEGKVYSDQLKSKKGTRFSAFIKLTDDGDRTGVELEFPKRGGE